MSTSFFFFALSSIDHVMQHPQSNYYTSTSYALYCNCTFYVNSKSSSFNNNFGGRNGGTNELISEECESAVRFLLVLSARACILIRYRLQNRKFHFEYTSLLLYRFLAPVFVQDTGIKWTSTVSETSIRLSRVKTEPCLS